MTVQNTIENKIKKSIITDFLIVENESHMHNVPKNSESHFKVTIVCKDFEGMQLLERHKLLNNILKEELEGKIHALSLHAMTPNEWKEKNFISPDSPPCKGGSKS
ncbi:MAG: BolA/IbaG family iron-sulfur metabolism protein [Pseudomonadota bacterium]